MNKIVAALLAVLVAAPAWADGVIIKGNTTFDANYPEAYSGQSGSPAGFTVGGAASDPNAGLELKAKGSGVVSVPSPATFGGTLGVTGAATFSGTINGGTITLGTLGSNGGNTFLQANPSTTYTGTESTFTGLSAGGAIAIGSFNTITGLNAEGIGGGCPNIYVNNSSVYGTDAMRNTCGNGQVTLFGTSAMKTYNQAGTGANNYAFGMAGLGESIFYYWNAPVAFPYDTTLGDQSCMGASTGLVSFTGVLCLGAKTGSQLTLASNVILMSGGGNGWAGATTFASGSNVILISSGKQPVDTPAANTSNFINIDNAYIASTSVPTYVSGFGTNAGWNGTASGYTSQHFGWTVGTGGTASTGVFAFPTAAPNGWYCSGKDATNPGSFVEDFSTTSTTQVTVTNYSRTTGAVAAWTSGDILDVTCTGY